MFDTFVAWIQNVLLDVFGEPWLVSTLLAALPIVEARIAVPMAISYGYGELTSFLIGFIGSSLPAPILLIALIPIIKSLQKTRIFGNLSTSIYDKFEQKSKTLSEKRSDRAKFWAVLLFVAVPLPLTGVWTGCAVASLAGVKFGKALLAVVLGNAVAAGIITLLCCFFSESVINCIITVVGVCALVTVATLLVKALIKSRSTT